MAVYNLWGQDFCHFSFTLQPLTTVLPSKNLFCLISAPAKKY